MVYALGDVSGAHMNPAVSVSFWLAGRFSGRAVPGYVAAQLAGAFAASLLLRAVVPEAHTLGETVPSGSAWRSGLLEFVLTFMLMLVILRVSTGPKERGLLAGCAIGAVVALEALFAGPVSGASMNPARSLAPAVISGRLDAVWLYLVAPTAGAAAAVPVAALLAAPSIPLSTEKSS